MRINLINVVKSKKPNQNRGAEESQKEEKAESKATTRGRDVGTFCFLQRVIERLIDQSSSLSFDKTNRQHLLLVCLYMRIIELGFSCAILIKNRIISGVPILLRSTIEAFADLKSLSKDESYADVMAASYAEEWRRLYGNAIEGNNPYLGKISEMANLRQMNEENKKKLDDLKKKGCVALTHRKRFEKAGMAEEYFSIYNDLCSHSHSNIRSLLDRHTHIERGDFKVMFFKEPEQREIDLYSTDLCDRIVEASLIIHSFLDSHQFSKIENIHKDWESLKENLLQKAAETGGSP